MGLQICNADIKKRKRVFGTDLIEPTLYIDCIHIFKRLMVFHERYNLIIYLV